MKTIKKDRKLFSECELILWDPIEDAKQVGTSQWWFSRRQGRFFNYYLSAN